jgi:hypothetical protein
MVKLPTSDSTDIRGFSGRGGPFLALLPELAFCRHLTVSAAAHALPNIVRCDRATVSCLLGC